MWKSRLEASATHVNISPSLPEDSEVVQPQNLLGDGPSSPQELSSSSPLAARAQYSDKVLLQH